MGAVQPPVRRSCSVRRSKPGDPASRSRSLRVAGSRPAAVAVSVNGSLPRTDEGGRGGAGSGALAGGAGGGQGAALSVGGAGAGGDVDDGEAVAVGADAGGRGLGHHEVSLSGPVDLEGVEGARGGGSLATE